MIVKCCAYIATLVHWYIIVTRTVQLIEIDLLRCDLWCKIQKFTFFSAFVFIFSSKKIKINHKHNVWMKLSEEIGFLSQKSEISCNFHLNKGKKTTSWFNYLSSHPFFTDIFHFRTFCLPENWWTYHMYGIKLSLSTLSMENQKEKALLTSIPHCNTMNI